MNENLGYNFEWEILVLLALNYSIDFIIVASEQPAGVLVLDLKIGLTILSSTNTSKLFLT